jgi:signal transduction histidine kinase
LKYTLRSKIISILLIVFSLLGGTAFFLYRQVMIPSFHDLERQQIDSNVRRVDHAIENELHHLSVITNDWAAWDDTYKYIVDHNPEYEISNLGDSTFSLNQLNLIYLIDTNGQKVWGKVFAEDFETAIAVEPFSQNHFTPDFPLLNYGSDEEPLNEQHLSGLIMTGAGPMLCAARPILDSNDNGPSHGTLIMGRFLDQNMIQKISRLTDIEYKAVPVAKHLISGSADKSSVKQNYGDITYQVSGDSLLASTIYTDILGKPALEITVVEQRKILDQGIKAMRIALTLMVIGIALALTLLMLVLQRSIVTPIKHITENILSWHQSEQPWTTPNIGKHVSSEISSLAEGFGQLIVRLDNKIIKLAKHQNHLELLVDEKTQNLKDAQSELLQRERLTTLGRLTATVSHEILNPLATVRNSFFLVRKGTENNNPEIIERALELAERNIRRSISIVEELNSYARIKRLNLAETSLDDWLKCVLDEQTLPDDINCELNLSNNIQASFDQEKLRQVIVNIFNNAVHALQEINSKGKLLRISTHTQGSMYEIHFIDNGVGMSSETKEKLFEPLYSTKNFGVGLGMVIVKNITEQHGGEIDIDSKEGAGTTITLRLPITPPKETKEVDTTSKIDQPVSAEDMQQ